MLLEARDDTATRQGDGQTTYDGTVQPGAVGMEVERSTDGAVGGDDDGLSTDTATAGRGRGRGRPNGQSKTRLRAKKRKRQGATERTETTGA